MDLMIMVNAREPAHLAMPNVFLAMKVMLMLLNAENALGVMLLLLEENVLNVWVVAESVLLN